MDECCETGETESSREMSGAIFGSSSSGGGVCVYGLGGSGTKTTQSRKPAENPQLLPGNTRCEMRELLWADVALGFLADRVDV